MKRLFEIEWSENYGKDNFASEKLLDYILEFKHLSDLYVVINVREMVPNGKTATPFKKKKLLENIWYYLFPKH